MNAVSTLLRHLDNDLPRVRDLLAQMLPQRDQWLRHTGSGRTDGRRTELEVAFAREISRQLHTLRAAIPQRFHIEIAALARHAAQTLEGQCKESPLRLCSGLTDLPSDTVEALPAWKGLAELFLTAGNGWRKRVDVSFGFAPGSGEKTRMQEVLMQLSGDESLREQFVRARRLPQPRFDDVQWRMLEALLTLLPLTVAQLQLVFAEHAQVDYAEVALRALAALGAPERPTDLALALDFRIRHLLVDEFQDTSINQFTLLERLTAGWENGDGRTLFLVGDPMQSIYRFREAQVGLVLRAQQHGIGTLRLTPLTLSVNSRSQQGVVDWVNAAFSGLFPAQADAASGAVAYSPSSAKHAVLAGAAVQVHPFFSRNPEPEAEQILTLIREAQAENLQTAVLVRSRKHLSALVPRLRRAGIRFRAMELESLGERPVVRDLIALTCALAHPADRTAWLAVLRAPWCGLELNDLFVLAGDDPRTPVPSLLADDARCALLSAAGQARLARVRGILQTACAERGRGTSREQVERVWLRLAGPCTLATLADLDDAEAFLGLLEDFDAGGALTSVETLSRALAELFAQPDPQADDSLQLMTIHKAKGLEFDVVIVPGLGFDTGRIGRQLLLYLERTRTVGEPDLLLAPLNARGSDRDALYELVLDLRKEQETFEQLRLLYVAATRAKQRLHLLGHTTFKEQDGKKILQPPRKYSLLAAFWPAIQDHFERALTAYTPPVATDVSRTSEQTLRRLPHDWQAPAPPKPLTWAGGETLAAEMASELEFIWVGDTLRHIGNVVHRLLQRVATEGLAQWNAARLHASRSGINRLLQQAGVPAAELEAATTTVIRALSNTLEDDTGRLILASRDDNAHCEYALNGFVDSRLVTGVIDRTFVDNDGVRWIVDYKTSRHEGTDRAAFLQREAERYRPQLARYASLMQACETRPIRVGLYFPLLGTFHKVGPG